MGLLKKYFAFFVLLLAFSHIADQYLLPAGGNAADFPTKKSGKTHELSAQTWALASSFSVSIAPSEGFLPICSEAFAPGFVAGCYQAALTYPRLQFWRMAALRAGFLRTISHSCIPKQAP